MLTMDICVSLPAENPAGKEKPHIKVEQRRTLTLDMSADTIEEICEERNAGCRLVHDKLSAIVRALYAKAAKARGTELPEDDAGADGPRPQG